MKVVNQWLFRAVLLWIGLTTVVVLVGWLAVRVSAEDSQTIELVVVGDKFDDQTVQVVAADIQMNGRLNPIADESFEVTKRSELTFCPPADLTIEWERKTKNIFGFECLLGSKEYGVKQLTQVRAIKVQPGWRITASWDLPEPVVTRPTPPPILLPTPDFKIGFYFWLEWVGESGSIHPDYPLRWGGDNGELVPVWEMTGNQLTDSSLGVPTVQYELGGFSAGLIWQKLDLPVNPTGGQLHFALRDRWGSPILTGTVPSLAVERLPRPTTHRALAYWDGENWGWVGIPQ